MITTIPYLLLTINWVSGQVISPGCNYAETATHFYPIGACDKTKTIGDTETTYHAFRFICDGGDVFKYEYNTDEYCDGAVTLSTNYTGQLNSFECDLLVCTYSNECSYTGCYDNTTDSCDECYANKTNYDRHCLPIITEHCYGNQGVELKKDTCSAGVLEENFYSGNDCTADTPDHTYLSGGDEKANNCIDDAYYEADCVARLLPDCDYAATGTHYYPIGACDRTATSNGTHTEYFAFNYFCAGIDGTDVYRNEYIGSDFCEGTAVSTTKQNEMLEHYTCSQGSCKYADGCTFTLNECDSNSCDYNQHCLPTIVDQCIGNEGELLYRASCSNNALSENFYYGDTCEIATFTDNFSGDDNDCGKDTYYKVQCSVPWGTLDYDAATECTKAPTMSPTVSTYAPSAAPTTSQPTTASPTTDQTTPSPEDDSKGDDGNKVSVFIAVSFVFFFILIN